MVVTNFNAFFSQIKCLITLCNITEMSICYFQEALLYSKSPTLFSKTDVQCIIIFQYLPNILKLSIFSLIRTLLINMPFLQSLIVLVIKAKISNLVNGPGV